MILSERFLVWKLHGSPGGAAEAAERQRRASALGRLKAVSSKLWEKTQAGSV